jgi:RNA recognition motif-containing protein
MLNGEIMSKKLYVGNLSYNATETELKSEFSQFGVSTVLILSLIVKRENVRGLAL